MRILSSILGALIAVVAVVFALSNRDPVSIGLWPLANRIMVSAYLIVLLPLAAGLILGAFFAGIGTMRARLAARAQARRASVLERELAALRGSQAATSGTTMPIQPLEMP